jgi:hypothetical protein
MTVRRLTGTLASTAVAALIVSGLAGCGTDTDQAASDPTSASAPTTSAAPTESATTTDSATESASTGDTVAVPAYFVGRTPMGERLYREFQRVPAANPVDGALSLIASDAAKDPDYTTLLPVGEGVPKTFNVDEGFAVAIPESWTEAPAGMSAQEVTLAIQQIVYTVQGALQQREPVSFVDADGKPTTIFGQQSPQGGFKAAAFDKVLALASVTTPEEGQQVSGTFTAEGVGSSFEGTMKWEVDDADGTEVLEGSDQMDGWMDGLYPWKADVDVSGLAPGTYTFVAETDDPTGGEGPGPTKDTRTIIVK